MKKLLLLSVIAMIAFSCKKEPEMSAIAAGSIDTCGFIKSWRVDTLYSTLSAHKDTMRTYFSGDTTLIDYHGQKLYAFFRQKGIGYNYSDSAVTYIGCYISPSHFDTTGAFTKANIGNFHYWSATYNTWKDGFLSITISSMYPHFDTSAYNFYTSN